MSITFHRDADQLEIVCDDCDRHPEYYDGPTFTDAFQKAKVDGWKARKDATGEWVHYCPECGRKRRGPKVDQRRRTRTDD